MEHIIDMHGTSETEQEARDKATRILKKAGYSVAISSVTIDQKLHIATISYEYEPIPGYVPSERDRG